MFNCCRATCHGLAPCGVSGLGEMLRRLAWVSTCRGVKLLEHMPRLKLCPRDYIMSPNWRYSPHYIDLRTSLILNEPHYMKNTLRRGAVKHIHRLIGAFVYSLSRIQKPAVAAFSLMTKPKSSQIAAFKVTYKCLPLNMYVQ